MHHWNREAGAVWLDRIRAQWPHNLWINPVVEEDWGYTQAAHAGSLELAREFSGRLNVLQNENTNPNDAGAVMEKMIERGAQIIFVMDTDFGEAVLQTAGRDRAAPISAEESIVHKPKAAAGSRSE